MNRTVDVKERGRENTAPLPRVAQGRGNACCGGSAASPEQWDPITSTSTTGPGGRRRARRGDAGLAGLRQPDRAGGTEGRRTVLDLGSGGGIDVLLSAKRVGPHGHGYGLDMTEQMLALARENKRKGGARQRALPEGQRSSTSRCLPTPVDVIISTACQPVGRQGPRAARGASRIKPGGRFAVSDVVVRGGCQAIRRNMDCGIGCVAGALRDADYLAKLRGGTRRRHRGDAGLQRRDAKKFPVRPVELLRQLGAQVDSPSSQRLRARAQASGPNATAAPQRQQPPAATNFWLAAALLLVSSAGSRERRRQQRTAILWDLDGTLVDRSEPARTGARGFALEDEGIAPPDDLHGQLLGLERADDPRAVSQPLRHPPRLRRVAAAPLGRLPGARPRCCARAGRAADLRGGVVRSAGSRPSSQS